MVRPAESLRPGPVRFRYGGRLALDFVNSVDIRIGPVTRDDLPDYESVVSWAWQMEVLDDDEAGLLERAALLSASDARAAHQAAIDLREGLYRVFRSIVLGQAAAAADLDQLDVFVAGARARQRLVESKPNFLWSWTGAPLDLHRPALSVALSAADLLTREDLSRVKQCPAPDGCGWLFYDETKNRSRRWCSMDQCGSTAKARRFAERHARPERIEASQAENA